MKPWESFRPKSRRMGRGRVRRSGPGRGRHPDPLVVVGLGRDFQGPRAKGLEAVAASTLLGVVDSEPGLLPVGQEAGTTVEDTLAAPAFAVVGVLVALGGKRATRTRVTIMACIPGRDGGEIPSSLDAGLIRRVRIDLRHAGVLSVVGISE